MNENNQRYSEPWFIMKRTSFSFRLFPMFSPSSMAVGISYSVWNAILQQIHFDKKNNLKWNENLYFLGRYKVRITADLNKLNLVKIPHDGSILGLSQIPLLTQLLQKMMLASKVVKIDSKIIISICKYKSTSQSVQLNSLIPWLLCRRLWMVAFTCPGIESPFDESWARMDPWGSRLRLSMESECA